METQSKKRPRRKAVSEPVVTGDPVMFVTVEEHQKAVNDKTSQVAVLENAKRACDNMIADLNFKINDLRTEIRDLRSKLGNLSRDNNLLESKYNSIPNWVKYLFGVK